MLKTIALITLKRRVDTNIAKRTLASAVAKCANGGRFLLSKTVEPSDPAAVGSTTGYDFVIEHWHDDNHANYAKEGGLFETDLRELMPLLDLEKSLTLTVREVVLKDPQPSGVKIVSLLRRNSDMSFEAFLDYWRDQHGVLVKNVPEFWRHIRGYVQNHPLQPLAISLAGNEVEGIDGIAQLSFADDEAARLAFSEARYLQIVRPDELILRSGAPKRLLVEEIPLQMAG